MEKQETTVEKKKPESIELISEQKWDKINLPINTSIIRFQMIVIIVFFLLLLIPLFLAITVLLSPAYTLVAGGLILIVYLFMFLMIFLGYMQSTTFQYIAESGKLYKVENNITGQTVGKIIVISGFFSKKTKNLPMNEFERVTVFQDFLGKMLNYGTVRLEQLDTLQNTQAIRLRYVKNPHEVGQMIQHMVDLAKQKMMTPQPPNPPVGF